MSEHHLSVISPNRVEHNYSQSIDAAPEAVFPLLCPVRELDWVVDWNPDWVISTSGVVEKDCVFQTSTGAGEAIWIVTHHDAQRHQLEMLKVTPNHTVGKLEIVLAPDGDGGTKALVSYTYTSLGAAGDEFLSTFTESRYAQSMQAWEAAINHYLRTGEKIAPQ